MASNALRHESRSWSTSTLLQGLDTVLGAQLCMDLSDLPSDVDGLRQELEVPGPK